MEQPLNETILFLYVLSSKIATCKTGCRNVILVIVPQLQIWASQNGSGFKHIGYVLEYVAPSFQWIILFLCAIL